MKQLIYENDVPQEFAEHKKYVEEIIAEFFDHLDGDCEIRVKFGEFEELNSSEHAECAVKCLSATEHELLVTNSALKTINNDGGRFFWCAIFHEFEHIADYIRTMSTNLFDFNLFLLHQNTMERQFIAAGYGVWTEIYAYYRTIRFARINGFNFAGTSFDDLVSNYNQVVEMDKQLYNKQDLTYDEAVKYIEFVNSFVYLCSKFIGSRYAESFRLPRPKSQEKNHKEVFNILKGIASKVKKLFKHPYGANFYGNLFELGKHVCVNVRWKIFDVGMTERDGRVTDFY